MPISFSVAAFALASQFTNAAPGHPTGTTPLVIAAVVAAVLLYARYQRQQSLKSLAESRRLQYLGKALPPDFPREMLGKLGSWYHIGRWRRSANVISGMEGSDRLLAFDAVVGRGRRRFEQTWVARRVSATSHPPMVDGDFVYRQAGPWRAIARKRQLFRRTTMTAATIEEMWQRLQ
jgi:hypothetical protein